MRFFTLLLDPNDRGISEEVRRSYEALPRRRGLEFGWQTFDHAAALTAWDDPWGDPLVAKEGSWVAAGMVRLDNRTDVERWAECECHGLTDLEVVLRVVARDGTRHIPRFLGEFAFAVWDGLNRTAVAACDAFAVRPLYYASRDGLIGWSSRAEVLALADRYDARYLVGLLTSYTAPAGLSVYAGVQSLRPASMARFEANKVRIHKYWSASDFQVESESGVNEAESIDACRRLLIESVRPCVTSARETWGQLSGGLDSSSVVSMALWLAERGEIGGPLAGTVTYVDRQGTQTDEREYSNTVVGRYGPQNVAIVDPPMWYDDTYPPIAPDHPGLDFHVQPREQRLCHAVRGAGGRALLTGYGGDELFASNMLFLADSVTQGGVLSAIREVAHLAAPQRVSLWELIYRNGFVPLVPEKLRTHLIVNDSPPGVWLLPDAVRKYASEQGSSEVNAASGQRGGRYHHAVVAGIERLQGVVHGGILADALDVRHPLLYRPLVEFVLRLPRALRSKPNVTRWMLREVVRGILPDKVRTRAGKPDTSDVLVWSLRANQTHLARLTESPILAELGLINPAAFKDAFHAAIEQPTPTLSLHTTLFPTLAVEAWLQIRSGRWPHPSHLSCK